MMKTYDAIILGGGLGGLCCGAILSREGLSVCILEQQNTIGGCLQSFRREGFSFDTGMHYVGSLSEGQTLNIYFKYFGILDKIKTRQLDKTGFDVINYCGKEYRHAIGYENFIDTLSSEFPEERSNIREYCNLLKSVGGLISPEVMSRGVLSAGGMEYMADSIYSKIDTLINSPVLKNVIAGSIPLYGYDRDKSSVYEHCMINNSNIESSYRFVDDTQHVADAFVDVIRRNGGEVFNKSKVTGLYLKNSSIDTVEVNNGECRMSGKYIISSLHPSVTLSLLRDNTVIRKAFFSRINSLENSFGLFTTYLLLKPGTFKYINSNYYFYNTDDVWSREAEYKKCNIPVILMSSQVRSNDEYSSVMTLMMPMNYSEVSKWSNMQVGRRGAEYEDFKSRYSQAMIDFTSQFVPELKSCIKSVYVTTPLTYQDYNSTPGGSAYGIIKDFHSPMINHLSPRTKIDNLFFTGQNINVHGCLGVSVSSAVTCAEILGTEYLAKKIANQ